VGTCRPDVLIVRGYFLRFVVKSESFSRGRSRRARAEFAWRIAVFSSRVKTSVK